MNELLTLLLLASVPAEGEVLLLDFEPVGATEAEAQLVTSQLAEALQGSSQLRVLTRQDVSALVSVDEARQVMDCKDDAKCVSQAALKGQFRQVISGSFGRVGQQFILSISMVDTQSTQVIGRAGATAASMDALASSMPDVARQLLGSSTLEVAATSTSSVLLPDQRFLVLDLESAGVSEDVAANLTDVVALELEKVPGATVLSKADVGAMVGAEQLRAVLDEECDRACFSEIAGALDARYLLVGRVGRLEDTNVISLTLLEQDSSEVRDRLRAHEAFRGDEAELIRATRHAARRLLGQATEGKGSVSVSSPVEGADVYLDDELIGALPLPPKSELSSGRHTIRLSKRGFRSWQSDVYVSPRETTPVWAELERAPERWYQKWWVWTIVGVAVVGATAGAVAASQGGPDSGSVGVSFE